MYGSREKGRPLSSSVRRCLGIRTPDHDDVNGVYDRDHTGADMHRVEEGPRTVIQDVVVEYPGDSMRHCPGGFVAA